MFGAGRPGGKLTVARLLDADGFELDDRERLSDVVPSGAIVQVLTEEKRTSLLEKRLSTLPPAPPAEPPAKKAKPTPAEAPAAAAPAPQAPKPASVKPAVPKAAPPPARHDDDGEDEEDEEEDDDDDRAAPSSAALPKLNHLNVPLPSAKHKGDASAFESPKTSPAIKARASWVSTVRCRRRLSGRAPKTGS